MSFISRTRFSDAFIGTTGLVHTSATRQPTTGHPALGSIQFHADVVAPRPGTNSSVFAFQMFFFKHWVRNPFHLVRAADRIRRPTDHSHLPNPPVTIGAAASQGATTQS